MAMTRRSLLGGLAATAAAAIPTTARAERRDPAAALWNGMELQDREGRTFQLRDLGKPVTLLHLWANWCPACLGEMASLAAAAAALGDARVEVVLVSHPQFWAADQAFAQRRSLPFRLATPSAANGPGVLDAALLENGAYVVPRSMMLGTGRDTLWTHMGAMSWSSPSAMAQLRTLAAG